MSSFENLKYLTGWNNEHATEALPGALPVGQNTPLKCPYGTYAEQINGVAFTVPRAYQGRSWMYRIHPSAGHSDWERVDNGQFTNSTISDTTPNQIRWKPLDMPTEKKDFVEGLVTVCGAGAPEARGGVYVHLFACNKNMEKKAFANADGDMLIVPEKGTLGLQTEMGFLTVTTGEICVVPRGIRFAVTLLDGEARGYVCEVFDGHMRVPDLGPIGCNGLANPRDFKYPVAAYEDTDAEYTVVHKFIGNMWSCTQDHSPFDVVAWHGNYAPFKYDLNDFCAVNAVRFDHMDPSIFTVITCQSASPGTAALDFVFFPPRWGVQENTFRPPYFHRNAMSEYMGLIKGTYEAKEGGFVPGGGSLHSIMTPHGPDVKAYEIELAKDHSVPERITPTSMAFMFESMYVFKLTKFGESMDLREKDYVNVWKGFTKFFDPNNIAPQGKNE